MTFEIDGQRYRIGFQHDKPKDWTAHMGHVIPAPTGADPVVISFFQGLRISAITLDKDGLYCQRCHVRLSGISPAIGKRIRAGHAKFLRYLETKAMPSPTNSHRGTMVDRELARNVHCIIYSREGDRWVSLYSGTSRLNTDAGDHYGREMGRLAALRHALPKKTVRESFETYDAQEAERRAFCHAAVFAYIGRARRTNKAGGQ